MFKKIKQQRAFSLIEIILAVSIFALSVMGLTGGLIYGQQSSVLAGHRMQAVFYAFEGLEASQNIADENFSNLIDGDFGLVVDNGSYAFDGDSVTSDIYERQITISSVDANTKQIVSRVSWSQGGTISNMEVEFTTYITNWK